MENVVRVESVNENSVVEQLGYVFNPRSVAVIGASNRIGTWGFGVLNRLLGNPKRKVYPVNSKSDEIMGIKAYRKITDIPEPVEFAVLSVPPAKTPEVMRECVAKGVKAALVITGGLAESGEEGVKLEKELVDIARKGGIRFIGPNSMGHINTHSLFSTLAWMKDVDPGPVAFLAQSGTYGNRIVRTGLHQGLGFSKFVSLGNEADLHLEDYIEYLSKDEETKIIGAYVEGLREGRRFFKLAKEITREKPIIIMKAGATEGSAKAAKSHTASLCGSDKIYDGMFKQSGVIRVEDEVELFDVINTLLSLPLPKGDRVGILTEGGGIGVVMAEATEKVGLELAKYSSMTTDTLRSRLPSRCSYANPTDITDLITSGELVIFSCLWTIMEDPNVDILVLLGGVGAGSYFSRMVEDTPSANNKEFRKMVKSLEEQEIKNLDLLREKIDRLEKPLVYVNLMPRVMEEPESFVLLRERRIPIFPSPRRAARALRHVVNYTNYLKTEV